MKKLVMILVILGFTAPSLAATVGGPDISIPEESLLSKREAVKKTLDRYDYNITAIKASVEAEFVPKRELASAAEATSVKLEGKSYMVKFSGNFKDIVEPYIKIGTAQFEVQWIQNNKNVTIETQNGFGWGAGVKANIFELKDYGIRLTLDTQYRNFDMDVDKKLIGSETGETSDATSEIFEMKEWQISLLGSKRIILPIGWKDYYLVPYAGLTYSRLDVDASFTKRTDGALYSTYNASDENPVGVVFGCDIMPSLLSWYLLNFEVSLVTETGFSLGGTVKF